MSQASALVARRSSKEDTSGIGGHPKGLTTLFFTEMWERFSYYGMRAILVLYLVAPTEKGGLGFDTVKATALYGMYTGSVYMTSLFGGAIADRFIGAKLAVLIGGIIIALGHFSMALADLPFIYTGLVLIVIGTGFLKPNVSTMVGELYDADDHRRDAGFSVFYMGINLGGFIAPLICGYLGQKINWHWGFAAAGVGMTLGLVQYSLNKHRLAEVGNPNKKARQSNGSSNVKEAWTSDELKRIAVIGILFFFSCLFWMAFEQAGSSLNLFADEKTSNSIFGWEFPSSWLQSVNSLFIIAFAPILSWLWIKLGKRQPSSPAKFAYGLLFTGLGFVVVALASMAAGAGKVGPQWLILVYFCHTIGELCLSPVGLSTVTQLAPKRVVGLMMGVFFFSLSVGNYAAGWVAGFYQSGTQGALAQLFGWVAFTTIAAAAVLWAMIPWIKKLSHEEKSA